MITKSVCSLQRKQRMKMKMEMILTEDVGDVIILRYQTSN